MAARVLLSVGVLMRMRLMLTVDLGFEPQWVLAKGTDHGKLQIGILSMTICADMPVSGTNDTGLISKYYRMLNSDNGSSSSFFFKLHRLYLDSALVN
jgi:hypothetical protein